MFWRLGFTFDSFLLAGTGLINEVPNTMSHIDQKKNEKVKIIL